MVASLLRDLVSEDFLDELDLSTLERVPCTYVTEDLQERHGDIVWRARWRGGDWCYVMLLLEFQSAPTLSLARAVSSSASFSVSA